MKLFTLPALLAAAMASVLVVIPFLPAAKPDPRPFLLELRAAATAGGAARVYYDIGQGYREEDSAGLAFTPSHTPQTLRFPLPAAEFRSLRLDPTDSAGTVRFDGDLRITNQNGRLRHTIPLKTIAPLEQVASLRLEGGRLEMVTAPGATDPQLTVGFSPTLVLETAWRDIAAEILPRAAVVFVGFAVLLLLVDRARARRPLPHALRSWRQRPGQAIALIAAAAVAASAYPVIFLGKSHVSPNFGTTLLYEAFPTLPGYTSSEMTDGNGSDVGAVMWAHVPYSFMQHRALARGEVPLWNRYSAAGTPLLAQGQSMLGDPLHALVIAANGAAWAWDLKFLVAKWLFATGLGLAVLTFLQQRALSAPNAEGAIVPAGIVAFAAPFIGFFVYRINHPAIFSLSHAPWVLYCWLRLMDAAGRRSVALWTAALFGANFALFHSGTVKEAYLLLLQMNLAGACLLLSARTAARARLAKLGVAAFAGVMLILINLPVWYPFLQTLQHAHTAYTHAVAFQIQPALLLGAFDELFFRPLSQGEIVFNPALNALLLLGLLYVCATFRLQLQDRRVVVLGLCAAVSLAFAFGVVPPQWIARMPLLAHVAHIENCFLAGFIVLGSVLAGVGFATAAERLGTSEGRTDLILGGVLLGILVAAWVGFGQASHRMVYGPGTTLTVVPANEVIPVNDFIWGSLGALLAASLTLGWVAQRAMTRRQLGAGGAILAAACVLVLLWRHGQHARDVGFERFVVRPPVRAPFHARSPAVDWVRAQHERQPGRVYGLHGNLTPGWNAAYDLETIHGPDALQNRWLRELIDVSPLAWSSSWRLYSNSEDVRKAGPFLDFLNVRHYLAAAGTTAGLAPALTPAGKSDLEIFASSSAWPRAFFTDRIDSYDTPDVLMAKILAGPAQPFAAVQQPDLANDRGVAQLSRDVATRTVNAATHYRLATNSTSFRVRANGPGLVVLNEAWWPDTFRVRVDGVRQPVVRVNHAFNGVRIESDGDHEVTFYYWPRHFLRVLIISATAALVSLLALFLALRPARTT